MPIYAYKCESCGYAKDALQKMSDAPLTDCPHCGAATFKKQLTAAGFQLKGSGWYVTDFRGGGSTGVPAGSRPAESGSGAADGNSAAAVPAAAAPTTAAPAPASSAGGDASSKPT